jgi:hypothetical protein
VTEHPDGLNVTEAAAYLRVTPKVLLAELAKGRIARLPGDGFPRFTAWGLTRMLGGAEVIPGHTFDPWEPEPPPPVAPRPRTQLGARRLSVRLRFAVLERCGFACVYCGRRPPDVALHVDHVHPVVAGGGSKPENLVAACQDCNLGKAARTGVRL